jgi:hypothetical protein
MSNKKERNMRNFLVMVIATLALTTATVASVQAGPSDNRDAVCATGCGGG